MRLEFRTLKLYASARARACIRAHARACVGARACARGRGGTRLRAYKRTRARGHSEGRSTPLVYIYIYTSVDLLHSLLSVCGTVVAVDLPSGPVKQHLSAIEVKLSAEVDLSVEVDML